MGANLRGPAARASPGASPPLRHRDGVAVLGRWKAANTANLIMLAVLLARIDRDRRSLWRGTIDNANLSVGGLPVFDDFFWGESRKCGLGGQKSRFHRHRTRPPRVDDCGRGREGARSHQFTETTPRHA